MTQDFRQIGLGQPGAHPSPRLDGGRRVVILTLYASAIAFLLCGVWLMVAEQGFVEPEITPILAAGLIVSAVSDFVVILVLKRVWSGNANSG